MPLLLYSSYLLAPAHRAALHDMVNKPAEEITFAAIANAADVEQDSAGWVGESRDSIAIDPTKIQIVDLREWLNDRAGLRELLASKDVIWVCGGNGFYLRWILKESGADEIIRELVAQGKVYAGWSAGAVLAGPTLRFFESVEDLTVVPQVYDDALGLTDIVVLPHMDLEQFAEPMKQIDAQLRQAGYRTAPLVEAQALVIDEDGERVI